MFKKPNKYESFEQLLNLIINNLDQVFVDLESASLEHKKQILILLNTLQSDIRRKLISFASEVKLYE